MIPLPKRIAVDHVVAHSYRDFHAKGVDYICLKRSPAETLKLYFLDGDVSKLPEVVLPHDHRYDFSTYVVAGEMENVWYREGCHGKLFQRFKYRTPLNGGSGFTYDHGIHLAETRRTKFGPGDCYLMAFWQIHTIKMLANETVLFLRQYDDRIDLETPSHTYSENGQAPSLDGLYNRFTADQVIDKLNRFEDRTGYRFEMESR